MCVRSLTERYSASDHAMLDRTVSDRTSDCPTSDRVSDLIQPCTTEHALKCTVSSERSSERVETEHVASDSPSEQSRELLNVQAKPKRAQARACALKRRKKRVESCVGSFVGSFGHKSESSRCVGSSVHRIIRSRSERRPLISMASARHSYLNAKLRLLKVK